MSRLYLVLRLRSFCHWCQDLCSLGRFRTPLFPTLPYFFGCRQRSWWSLLVCWTAALMVFERPRMSECSSTGAKSHVRVQHANREGSTRACIHWHPEVLGDADKQRFLSKWTSKLNINQISLRVQANWARHLGDALCSDIIREYHIVLNSHRASIASTRTCGAIYISMSFQHNFRNGLVASVW